jgi:hypothetical protein
MRRMPIPVARAAVMAPPQGLTSDQTNKAVEMFAESQCLDKVRRQHPQQRMSGARCIARRRQTCCGYRRYRRNLIRLSVAPYSLVRKPCEVVWRRGRQFGVKFKDEAPGSS